MPVGEAHALISTWKSSLQVESSAALFRSALATLSGISRLLLATSKELGMSEMGLAGLFARVAVNRELNVSLWEATHEVVLPPLAIRRAKVDRRHTKQNVCKLVLLSAGLSQAGQGGEPCCRTL
jgi:hypothetical protein